MANTVHKLAEFLPPVKIYFRPCGDFCVAASDCLEQSWERIAAKNVLFWYQLPMDCDYFAS
ncbi:MAG TPA: hypothetical protein DEA22_14000 [Blastocatellia bacterium]|nr:hypothetical protein [Blastocatellia bacterium]